MNNNHKKIILAVSLALIVIVLAILILSRNKNNNPVDNGDGNNTVLVESINGTMVDISKLRRTFAVMVENHVDARPQSGLSQADIVYETVAEGGITRFMAIFQTEDVAMIGPIRSARKYFNDWAKELKPILVHVGGSADALAELRLHIPGVSDADQYFNDAYFMRITSRSAPHNTYTSIEKLLSLAEERDFDLTPSYAAYSFKDDQAENPPLIKNVSIDFSLPSYKVSWVYDAQSNSYERFNASKKSIDAENSEPIKAKNVIIQKVVVTPVPGDPLLLVNINTQQGGSAEFFLDGKKIKGLWKVVDGRTKFYNQSDVEMQFNRGKTWIEAVPSGNAVIAQ